MVACMSECSVPVYLISTPGSMRVSWTLRHLAGCGLDVRVVDGVVGSALLVPAERRRLEAEFVEFAELGGVALDGVMDSAAGSAGARVASLACCLSHLRCLRMIAAAGLPCALVLEDDALLHPLAASWLDRLALTCGRWDVLRLHMGDSAQVYGPRLGGLRTPAWPGPGLDVHQYLGGHTGAVALLYSAAGVGKILEMQRMYNADLRLCFDSLFGLWYLCGLRYCFVRPSLAVHNPDMVSTIYAGVSNRRYNRNIVGWFSLRGRLARGVRRVRTRYVPAPRRLWSDAGSLVWVVVAFLNLWRAMRRMW